MVSLTTEYVLMNFIVHFHPLQAVKVSEFIAFLMLLKKKGFLK